MTTFNTLLCHHVYIWNDFEHADSTWRKVPRSLLNENHRFESVYPHNFRLVAFGKRSYVDQRRNDISSGSSAINNFFDNLNGSISFHFFQAHCLVWVTAVAVLCSSSNYLTSSLTMFVFPFGPTSKKTLLLVLPRPARLVWVTPMMSFISLAAFRLLGGLNVWPLRTWFYFSMHRPNNLVGWVLNHQIKAYFTSFIFFYLWRYWELKVSGIGI